MNIRNQVQLIGHIGKDIELKTIQSGAQVASFTMATQDNYKNATGERVTDTQWHNIVAWGKQAELMAQLLSKGKKICLQGKLMHRSYDDAQGIKRYVSEVRASGFELLTKKEDA